MNLFLFITIFLIKVNTISSQECLEDDHFCTIKNAELLFRNGDYDQIEYTSILIAKIETKGFIQSDNFFEILNYIDKKEDQFKKNKILQKNLLIAETLAILNGVEFGNVDESHLSTARKNIRKLYSEIDEKFIERLYETYSRLKRKK